jgi:hypothetical protein
MVQTLMDSQNLDLASKAQETMLETLKAAQKSAKKPGSCSAELTGR